MKTFLYICLGSAVIAGVISGYELIGTIIVTSLSAALGLYLVWTWVELIWVSARDKQRKRNLLKHRVATSSLREHRAKIIAKQRFSQENTERLTALHSKR